MFFYLFFFCAKCSAADFSPTKFYVKCHAISFSCETFVRAHQNKLFMLLTKEKWHFLKKKRIKNRFFFREKIPRFVIQTTETANKGMQLKINHIFAYTQAYKPATSRNIHTHSVNILKNILLHVTVTMSSSAWIPSLLGQTSHSSLHFSQKLLPEHHFKCHRIAKWLSIKPNVLEIQVHRNTKTQQRHLFIWLIPLHTLSLIFQLDDSVWETKVLLNQMLIKRMTWLGSAFLHVVK